jgi:toxin ParE1/3/4
VGAVRWTPTAADDLEQIHKFIARVSLAAADSIVERLLDAADRLDQLAARGRALPEAPDAPFRELLIGEYRLIYRTGPDVVWIAAIQPGRRPLNTERLTI